MRFTAAIQMTLAQLPYVMTFLGDFTAEIELK